MSLIFAFPLHRQTIYVLFSPHKFVEQEENNAQEACIRKYVKRAV